MANKEVAMDISENREIKLVAMNADIEYLKLATNVIQILGGMHMCEFWISYLLKYLAVNTLRTSIATLLLLDLLSFARQFCMTDRSTCNFFNCPPTLQYSGR